jgi:hypothetical protein
MSRAPTGGETPPLQRRPPAGPAGDAHTIRGDAPRYFTSIAKRVLLSRPSA